MQVTMNAPTRANKWKRTASVKVRPSDAWTANRTAAFVLVPLLKSLRKVLWDSSLHDDASDYPYCDFDLADLPEELRAAHVRIQFRWMLDEMIWAFDQYRLKKGCMVAWPSIPEDEFETLERRVDNGLRLFGRYYQSLYA